MAEPAGRIRLEVVTPLGLVLRADVVETEAPSVLGEFGVLPGHLPLLAALGSGVLRYRTDSGTRAAAVGPGFVEAGPDKMLLLTESFEKGDEVDVEQARKDLTDAEARLAGFGELHEGGAYEEILRSLAWARARVEASEAAKAHAH
ncbi:MAG: ATP synthase F1 subunit epsilon [Deltaproteobacteria bacterium]|nr:ATP synthase F1 subunit epsilon [Deltaproteobacteria bacterium]